MRDLLFYTLDSINRSLIFLIFQHMYKVSRKASKVFIQQIIFWNVFWINWTSHYKLPLHSTTIYDFDQIDKILLGFEASYELCVVWCAKKAKKIGTHVCT